MYRSSQHINRITRYIIERENDGSDGDDSDILMVMAVMKVISRCTWMGEAGTALNLISNMKHACPVIKFPCNVI